MKNKPFKLNAICNVCGAVIPDGNNQCLICGTPAGKSSFIESNNHNQNNEITKVEIAKQRRFPKFLIFILIIVLWVGALLTFAFEYYSLRQLEGIYNTNSSYAYQDGKNRLVIKLSNVNDPIVLDNNYSNFAKNISIKNSYDKRFVAYLNNQTSISGGTRGHLSLLDLTSLNTSAEERKEPTVVSKSRVIDYDFVPNSDILIYLTEEKELFSLNYSRLASAVFTSETASVFLDSGVSGLADISENSILYYKGNAAGINTLENNINSLNGQPVNLYTMSVDVNQTNKQIIPILIAENVYTILDSYKDYSVVLFTILNSENNLSVYSYKDATVTQLVANADFVSEGNAITGDVVYGIKNQKTYEFTQLFDDDLLAWDAEYDKEQGRLQESLAEEATLSEATTEPTSLDQDTLPATDYDPELPEGDISSSTSEEVQPTSTPDLEDFFETLPTDYKGTPLSYEQLVESKALRESLRTKLVMSLREYNSTFPFSYSLYYLSQFGETSQTLTNELYDFHSGSPLVVTDLKEGVVLFPESNLELINPTFLSQLLSKDGPKILDEGIDFKAYLAEHLPEQLYFFNTKTQVKNMLFTESGERVIVRYSLSDDHSEIYFIALPSYSSRGGTLYSVALDNGESGATVYVDDTVNKVIGQIGGNIPGLVYQTVSNDPVPEYELYLNASTGVIHLSSNTGSSRFVDISDDKNAVYFYRDYNSTNKIGSLFMVSDLTEQLVANNISSSAYLSDGTILFISLSGSLVSLHESGQNSDQKLISDSVYAYHLFDSAEFPAFMDSN